MTTFKTENIIPITDLQRAPGKIVSRLTLSDEPVIITQHGRPAAVLVSCKMFGKMEDAPSRGLVDDASERKQKLENELQNIVARIIRRFDPEKIILFGSLANGTVNSSSDIDLVVIMETDKRFWDRQKEMARFVRPKIACDILIYTPGEWADAIAEKRDFFSREVGEKGKVMYERAAPSMRR